MKAPRVLMPRCQSVEALKLHVYDMKLLTLAYLALDLLQCTLCKKWEMIDRDDRTTSLLSTSGGMGRAATVVYKRLATLISTKRNNPLQTIQR